MVQTDIRLSQQLLSPATGLITEVCLIESDGTADLQIYLGWLRAMRIQRGILLLVNVPEFSPAALETLREITALGIDVLPVQFAGTVNTKPGTPHSFPLPAADIVLGAAGEDGHRTLYLGDFGRQDFKSLRYDHRFRTALRRLGYQTIACRDEGQPSLEGGDCLLVGDHLFLGRGTQERFGGHAACAAKEFYQLPDTQQVHFIGVDDPSPAEGLYHLDLYFTYGGPDAQGRHRFFAGYMHEQSAGDAVAESMRAQLDKFHTDIRQTLDACFGSQYTLTAVPLIVCDIYRVSPLNGIAECVNGAVRYYFPWPTYETAKEHPTIDIAARVTAATQEAWDIMSRELGEGALVRCPVPISYTAGSGQSLHCTVGVLGRSH